MQFFRADYGTAIAIGIKDTDKQQIEYEYFSFYNFGATTGELHWITENFGYFWTTPSELRRSLINKALFKLLNIDCGRSKGKKRGLMPEAIKLSQQIMDEIEVQHFLGDNAQPEVKQFKMGYLDYFSPDLNFIM